MLVNKHLLVAIDFQCMENITMEINGYCQLFVFIRRKKLKHVLNNLRIFIFE